MRKLIIVILTFIVGYANAQEDIENLNLLLVKSKFTEALELSKQLIVENPDNSSLYYLQSIINKQLFRYPDASKSIKKAIALNPDNVEFLNEYASILGKRNRDIDALKVYKQIIDIDKYNLNAGIFLSNHYLKNKQVEKAQNILFNLHENDTLNSYFTRNIGLCYIRLGKKKEALEWLHKTLKLDNEDVKAYALIARVYSATEEFDLALENIEEAIKIDSQNKDLYKQAGDVHVMRNHNYRAIPMYLKAYEIKKDPYDARNIGFCYYKIKKYDLAKHYLLIADADGLDLQVKTYLGDIYQKLEVPDTSISYYDQALEIIIPDFDSMYSLHESKAETYYYMDDFEKAIENYLLAYNTNVKSYWLKVRKNNILINIAAIYEEKLNDKHKAIEYLEMVQNEKMVLNDNHYQYAQQQINKLKEELFFENNL